MSHYSKIAEEEFQKLPLKEKKKLVSVVQTWNKAFECGVIFAMKNVKGNKKEIKENAELKEIVIKMNNVITETFSNLTKAKKLLKKVVTDFHNMDCVTVHIDKTIAEAEQFLSEVEK